MSTMRVGTLAVVVMSMLAVACGETPRVTVGPPNITGATDEVPGSASPAGTSGSGTSDSGETTVSVVTPTEPTVEPTETTTPVVTIEIVGTAVAGNSGGEGEGATQTLSETVRNTDGTCSGWKGPGDAGLWTEGLEVGAPVQILDRETDAHIGDGKITASSWADVDPSNHEQWNCTFSFSGTVSHQVEAFKIKVADLAPWVTRPDPTKPGSFIASVDTQIELSRISNCTDREAGQPISEWQAVGQFWVDGLSTLCANGLVVEKIQRPCRPPNAGSEYITVVRSAADPNVIYEDAGGLRIDASTLAPDTKVIVDVATGRPC